MSTDFSTSRMPVDLVRSMVDHASSDDLSVYEDIFAPSFSFNGAPFTPAQMMQVSRDLSVAFPDRSVLVEELGGTPDTAWLRWSMSGTHSGPYHTPDLGELAPTQSAIRVWGLETFKVDRGKITEFWSAQNRLDLYRQLGLTEDTCLRDFRTV